MTFPIVASRHDYVNVFFNQLAPIVVNEYIRRKGQKRLFPSTVLAMAALESGYNLKATTLFGIKGDGVVLDTTEYINGEYVNVKDSFKAYPNISASVQGLYDLMQWVHYDRATSCIDYEEECRMIQACGYATDPDYADKLINIVNSYKLTMFNTEEIADCTVSDYTVCYYQCFPGGLHFKNSERSFDCICGIGDFAVSFAVYHFCYGQAFPYE